MRSELDLTVLINQACREYDELVNQAQAIDEKLRFLHGKGQRALLVRAKNEAERSMRLKKAQIRDLRFERHALTIMGNGQHIISDHALVRWLEREKGINVGRLKDLIVSPGLSAAITARHSYWSDGGLVFVLGENVVKTVIKIGDPRAKKILEGGADE